MPTRTTATTDQPAHIGLLPDGVARAHLTSAVLRGDEVPPARTVDRLSTSPSDRAAPRWEAAPVRQLLLDTTGRFRDHRPTTADRWLAPRLHTVLRLTRAEAADPALWNHLALRIAPEYVVWRWCPAGGAVAASRFSGPFHVQALARLWWAAELFRDGPDYAPVVTACANQDVLNTVLRSQAILHRPVAQALLRLVGEDGGLTGREVNALSAAVGAAGSTLLYEVLAPDAETDTEAVRAWIGSAHGSYVPYDTLPEGPDDVRVPQASVDALVPRFRGFLADAEVRGRAPVPAP
ncbi:DUF6339 family protein [Yinghuangia seranimata]|uniref:DUF6339 family protein n=1 Tax=Yinghuangia seranimata TaxID=408067 RepID=UPI00248C6C7B|nr:DUF6339 family protein [Yinghuangia seranimata]MDI2130874.1 DUF6339 family protein [Yinghuangia seranimata]